MLKVFVRPLVSGAPHGSAHYTMLNYVCTDCSTDEVCALTHNMRLPLTRFLDETGVAAAERTCILDFASIDVSQSLAISLPTEYAVKPTFVEQ